MKNLKLTLNNRIFIAISNNHFSNEHHFIGASYWITTSMHITMLGHNNASTWFYSGKSDERLCERKYVRYIFTRF